MQWVTHAAKVFPFDEATVRRLCGPAVFARADAIQRDGDVLGPTDDGDLLRVRVRGTWTQIVDVTLSIRGNRVQPTCSRDGDVFCRHSGALMLEVLRNPAGIVSIQAGVYDDDNGNVDPDDFDDESTDESIAPTRQIMLGGDTAQILRDELAMLLHHHSVPQMRELAKRRSVTLSGSKRDDILNQVATALSQPENVDDALAGLTEPLATALDAIFMGNVNGPAPATAITAGFNALGGSGQPPLQGLQDLGLAFKADVPLEYGWHATPHYAVPHSVLSRLAPTSSFAQPARTGLKLAQRSDGKTTTDGLGIDELVLLLASEARAGRLLRNAATELPDDLLGFDEYDDEFDDGYRDDLPLVGNLSGADNLPPVTPPDWLANATSRQLAERLDQPIVAIELTAHLMLTLGILEYRSPYNLREDRLDVLLAMPRAARCFAEAHAWIATGALELFTLLFGPTGRLKLELPSYHWLRPLQDAIGDTARLMLKALGRMTPDTWFSTTGFVETLDVLVRASSPEISRLRQWSSDPKAYSLFRNMSDGTQLKMIIKNDQDWMIFLKAIVIEILSGPASWLGLVDIDRSANGRDVPAFRVSPLAATLTARDVSDAEAVQSQSLAISDDLTLFIRAGATSDIAPAVLGLLSRSGELIEASSAGLKYQITASGAHLIFHHGMTGDALIAFLEQHSGHEATLPPTAVTTIQRWWKAYGAIRLYDELALIELSDDVLLPELLAASALRKSVLHTFSPRLIAVDPGAVDAVVADLTARGYTPRVIEDV